MKAAFSTALCLALCLGCREQPEQPEQLELVELPPQSRAPDRVEKKEAFSDAVTAFGLPVPPRMRLSRYFSDSAYLSGRLTVKEAVAHVQQHILAGVAEVNEKRTLFPRAYIKGDVQKRLFRIEVSASPVGSQVRIKDITPPPSTHGLSEAERWRRAGRNPDGTLLNPNEVF